MHEIGNIRTFEDEAFGRRITVTSVAVLVAGLVLPVAVRLFLACVGRIDLTAGKLGLSWGWIAGLLAATACSLLVHELVHGIFFKLFAPSGSRVTFGANWKAGMLYACADGIVYTRRRYLACLLAPTVSVTFALGALAILTPWRVLLYIVAICHLSGCTGDWEYARQILANPAISHCEDMSWGVRFLAADEEGSV